MIRLRKEEESLDNIGQYWVDCATPEAKFNAISNIYGVVTIGQAMIFCQTRNTAKWLVDKMTAEGHAVALLSGELSVEDRISVCIISSSLHNFAILVWLIIYFSSGLLLGYCFSIKRF